jgi:hypothetical protein
MTDAVTLLRELRPQPPHGAPDDAALERLLRSAPEPPPLWHRRRAARPLAAAVAIAAVGLVVVALAPTGREAPSVVARAAAALSEPDTILHFKAVARFPREAPEQFESWQTTSGRQQRTLYDGLELAEDQDARTLQTFNAERNELVDHTDPDYFARPPAGVGDGGIGGMVTIVGDLRALLQRAADHDDAGVELLADTEVRGIAVHHLRVTRSIDAIVADGPIADPRNAPTRKVTTVRDVYVSTKDDLPVRVVDHAEVGNRAETTFDFLVAERMPLNAQTRSLLRMAPHPGAREVDEGPFR